jgi:hypothetical protein
VEAVHLEILPQPDDVTCGPTCLHAVYRYFGDELPLDDVIAETGQLDEGGTLGSWLGCHALRRGYQAKLYTFNLRVLDPTWFRREGTPLADKLRAQLEHKNDPKLRIATRAYLDFLHWGGEIRMEDLTRQLIRKYLLTSTPILAGLSSTYLYQNAREYGPKCDADDVRGVPQGHFVVLCGYDRGAKMVRVADPYLTNPYAPSDNYYWVGVDRLVCAVLLGVLTYDANLLILTPGNHHKGMVRGDIDRRE